MALTKLLPWLYAATGMHRCVTHPLLEPLYVRALFAYKRLAEDPFDALVRRQPILFASGHVLDVGANAGYTASVFARAIESPYKVFAFEPEPVNVRRMRSVLGRMRLVDRVEVIAAAVGESSGSVELTINPRHPGDHRVARPTDSGASIRVPMMSIDDFLDERCLDEVAFVKIDVQGFELAVSQGMRKLIERSERLAVAFEYSREASAHFGYEAGNLFSFYRQRGFGLQLIRHDGSLLDCTNINLARLHDERGYVDVLATRQGARRPESIPLL